MTSERSNEDLFDYESEENKSIGSNKTGKNPFFKKDKDVDEKSASSEKKEGKKPANNNGSVPKK